MTANYVKDHSKANLKMCLVEEADSSFLELIFYC